MDADEFDAPEEQDLEALYVGSAEEVARQLGVTPAGLRRLADIYDQVYPPLQRDPQQGRRRLWTFAAITRLEAARKLVQDGDVRSIKTALERGRDGGARAAQEGLAVAQADDPRDALLFRLLEHMERLETRMETMQRQLEAPRTEGSAELAEQRRMNAYLLGELERRRLEGEQPVQRRPWWRWWR